MVGNRPLVMSFLAVSRIPPRICPRTSDQKFDNILQLQWLVAKSFIGEISEHQNITVDIKMGKMPSNRDNAFDVETMVRSTLSIVIPLSIFMHALFLTMGVVEEREQRLLEFSKMIGLSSAVHWTSWFIYGFILLTIIMSILTAVLFVSVDLLYKFTSPTLFFVFCLAYCASVISFSFFMSVFFTKPHIAGVVTSAVLLILVYFDFKLQNSLLNPSVKYKDKWLLSLCFQLAFAIGHKIINKYEVQEKGATWGNLFKPPESDNFTLGYCLLMLLVDTFIFLFMTWYISHVWPGEYGIPQPVYFCFEKSYWCGHADQGSHEEQMQIVPDLDRYFAPKPSLPVGIKISNLQKDFADSRAVNIFDLEMYEGEIFVLLGHNGAGKTTTMSMLSGFIPPSSGTAYLNGVDIRYNLKEVQRNLGLCPQFSVYFELLTVEEHLLYFAKLKGNTSNQLRTDVLQMIANVGLAGQGALQAKTLSGGQKRKLSIAIALIGQSRILILDEPTCGLDPTARHELWEVLKGQKEGRTILMSTHFMDEADALGDRIAIMAESMVICCGPPMFLKKLYGTGCHLIIERTPDCDEERVTEFIKEHMPSATLKSKEKLELTYTLPDKESSLIPGLLRSIEENKTELGIGDYGASATTMEEVFLNVGKRVADVAQIIHQSSTNLAVENTDVNKVSEQPSRSKSDASTSNGSEGTKPATSKDVTSQSTSQVTGENASESSKVTSETSNVASESSNVASETKIEGAREGTSLDQFENQSANALPASESNVSQHKIDIHPEYLKLSGVGLLWSRIYGLLLKRMIVFVRSPIMLLVQMFMPPVILLFLYRPESPFSNVRVQPNLTIDFNLDDYTDESTIVYSFTPSDDEELADIASKYKGLFTGRHQPVEKTNVSEFLADEYERLGWYAYGHLYMIGAKFYKDDNGTIIAVAVFNPFPRYSQPISLNYVINALAKHYGTDAYEIQGGLFQLENNGLFQLENSGNPFDEEEAQELVATVERFLFLLTTLFLLDISCVYNLELIIKERKSGSKHLQFLAGASPLIYWGTNFIVDFLVFLVPNLLVIVVVMVLDIKPFSDALCLQAFTVVLILHCWSSIPFMFCMEALFKSPTYMMAGGLVFTFLFATFPIDRIGQGVEYTDSIFKKLFWILHPNYNYLAASLLISQQTISNDKCVEQNYTSSCLQKQGQCCKDYGKGCPKEKSNFYTGYRKLQCYGFNENYFGIIGKFLIALAVQSAVFFLLRVLAEYHVFETLQERLKNYNKAIEREREDIDVGSERSRVTSTPPSQLAEKDALLLVNLRKIYDDKVAVDNICVGVEKDECFGLLGQNGAGKTTTFKMISGMEGITSGDAYFNGISIRQHLSQVQSNMGYCPQSDALIDRMTGCQLLYMYARLRGIPADKIKPCVDHLVEKLDFKRHANKLIFNLSGGNRRKVSTAIALIGDPPLILLDEPSSGMDPGARIHMWEVLSEVRASGKTLVLTSHSMEECEALCTRITIMMKGRMVCLGSLQHIKSKFAQGYTMLVKMGRNNEGMIAPVLPVLQHIKVKLPSSYLFSTIEGFAHLQVLDPNVHLADVFEVLEDCKQDLNLEDYSVQQTSLEQVFLKLTHDLAQPEPPVKQSCLDFLCP